MIAALWWKETLSEVWNVTKGSAECSWCAELTVFSVEIAPSSLLCNLAWCCCSQRNIWLLGPTSSSGLHCLSVWGRLLSTWPLSQNKCGGYTEYAGVGKASGSSVSAYEYQWGVWRSFAASSERRLLGQCQPHWFISELEPSSCCCIVAAVRKQAYSTHKYKYAIDRKNDELVKLQSFWCQRMLEYSQVITGKLQRYYCQKAKVICFFGLLLPT